MGDIVREVEELAADGVREITLLGQNVNSYGRDLGAGQYRPQFADLLRALDAVEGIERIRFTSRTPRTCAPRRSRRWRSARRCASTCTCRCSRAATACCRAMHRGYTARALPRTPRRRARRDPGSRGHHRHHRRLPRRDRRRLRADPRGGRRGRATTRAYTFVFSPRPGTPAAGMGADFVTPEVVAGTHGPTPRSGGAPRVGEAQARGRAHRGGAARGAVEEGRGGVVGSHPPRQARALRAG